MKKACSVCLANCLRLHGAQGEDEDEAACVPRKPEEDERQRVQADRNPSFLKKMAKSTMSTLKLPLSFVRDQIDRLDGSVILEGPSRGRWRVELQGSFQSFSLNFGQGWEKFVADHVLQVDDSLTFSLSAKSYFQVEVYDGGGCLKTSALDAEVAKTAVPEAVRPVAKIVQPARSVADLVEATRPVVKVAETAVEAARPVAEVAEPARSVAGVAETEVVEAARSEGVEDRDSGDGLIQLAKSDQGGLLPEQHVVRGSVSSRRRPVTELEKQRALQAAESLELANPSILLVMSKLNVYKGFWLGIPKQFAKEWMPPENNEVKIVNKGGHSWPAKWIASRGGLSSGWRRFSLDHRLEEHDVCVLEMVDKANYVLLVHIFRVLWCLGEDLVLYPRTFSPKKRNKRKSSLNCHEADATLGESSQRKSSRRASHKSGLLGDDLAAPGDTAVLTGDQGESGAAEGTTPTAPQQGLTPTSFEQDGTSERKRNHSRHASEPDAAIKSVKRRRRLLEDDTASPTKGKELASPDHEEIGTSDGELLVQKSVDHRAGGAGDEVALRAEVEPQPVLALVCYESRSGGNYEHAERSSSARADVQYVNPDDVHEQIVNVPATGPFRGKKKETRREYKVVHIYGGRNFGNGTEFLAELEGYSERPGFASLDRDDDTGFWWVPYEQFGWDMMRCYIG